jgi:hypothetical protein
MRTLGTESHGQRRNGLVESEEQRNTEQGNIEQGENETNSTVRNDRFEEVEGRFPGYDAVDQNGEKIGTVQRLYVDENGQPQYLGVKRDFIGMNVEIIPFQIATVDDANERIELATDKDHAKNGPTFYEAQQITDEYERAVRSHYGL